MGFSGYQFRELVSEFEAYEHNLLDIKAGEYAKGDKNRLANFDEIGRLMGVEPEIVALTLLLKHIQGISNAVSSGMTIRWDWGDAKVEGLKQRIADARNYLLLLAACIDERMEIDRLVDETEGGFFSPSDEIEKIKEAIEGKMAGEKS